MVENICRRLKPLACVFPYGLFALASPLGRSRVAPNATAISWWNAKSGEFLGELLGNTDIILDLSFSPDSKKIATASLDGTIKIWDTTTKKELEILENPQGLNGSYSVDFHPNGAKLAVVGYQDGSIKVWDLNTKTPKVIGHHKISATFVRFSHDGRLLASSSGDGIIMLWKDDQFLTTIKADKKEIYGLAFSPSDQILASVGEDRTIKLWQIDGTLSKTLVAQGYEIYDISFSPNYEDDQLIASASEDRTIRLWKIILEEKFDGYAENIYADNFAVSGNVTSFSENPDFIRPCLNCKEQCSERDCKASIPGCCPHSP